MKIYISVKNVLIEYIECLMSSSYSHRKDVYYTIIFTVSPQQQPVQGFAERRTAP